MENFRMPSRSEMRALLLPKVGDFVENYRIIYTNNGKIRFTANIGNNEVPEIGKRFIDQGRIYEVSWLDDEKGRFTAEFKGFEQNTIPDAPQVEEEDLVRL